MLVFHVCTTWRTVEGHHTSLLGGKNQAAGNQSWPRATPATAKRGVQLHLVGSEAPPSVTRSLWPPNRDKVPQELNL